MRWLPLLGHASLQEVRRISEEPRITPGLSALPVRPIRSGVDSERSARFALRSRVVPVPR